MDLASVSTGKIYWVAGKGPMKVSELPHPARPKADERGMLVLDREKITITMSTPIGYDYWVSADELMSEMTPAEMAHYREEVHNKIPHADVERRLEQWQKELEGGEATCMRCDAPVPKDQSHCSDEKGCYDRLRGKYVPLPAEPKIDDSWRVG
jgi:ribosomal protein L40E